MFYKKFISFFVVVALTLCALCMSAQVIFAKANVDAHDEYFLEFVREDTGIQSIDYTRIQLYDATLTPNGRQYVFEVGGVEGYALTNVVRIGEQIFYEIEELFYNTPAPFNGCQGLPVYLTFNTYLDYVDGVFYDLTNSRAVVPQQTIDELTLKGFGYMGTAVGDFVTTNETISFSTRTTETYTFPYGAPDIFGSVSGSCCAHNAGGVVIGYYDRMCENLIPNYQSYFTALDWIFYNGLTAEMTTVIETLQDYMAVEGVTQGTTFTGFQQGMERYVEEKGYTYATNSVMSWGNLNYTSYQNYVEQEKPVVVFLNGFTMSNIAVGDTADTISRHYNTATHVVVGIGYKTDTYKNANGGIIATRKYLYVVSGLFDFGLGYLNISSGVGGDIVNAIAVDIS